ncbi:MAG: hypothetical protein ACTSU5_05195 [Promethearchaeota archaeon]
MTGRRGVQPRGHSRRRIQLVTLALLSAMVSSFFLAAAAPGVQAKPFPHKERVRVLAFSWREKSPFLTSLSLKNEYWGDFETDYYIVTVVTADTWAAKKDALNFSSYDVFAVDSFLPEDVSDVQEIMRWINGTRAEKSLLFFGGGYPQDAMEEFSDLLPVDIVAHRKLLNNTLTGLFQNATGLPGTGFDELANFTYNSMKEYNNETNQVEVEVTDEANNAGSIYRSPCIAWGSCPLLKQRIQTLGRKSQNALTIVQVPSTKEPIIVEGNFTQDASRKGSQVMYISTGTIVPAGDDEWNKPMYLWPYWNYFMYVTMYRLKHDVPDSEIQSYADWPYSPIPHERESALWMMFVLSLWVFNFVLFFWLGRKGKKKRSAAETDKMKGAGEKGEDKGNETGESGAPVTGEPDDLNAPPPETTGEQEDSPGDKARDGSPKDDPGED